LHSVYVLFLVPFVLDFTSYFCTQHVHICGIYTQNGNHHVRVWVRVMVRAWLRVRVLFCSSIAQFLTILCIPHCTDVEWV